eukprot:scaffold602_cov298-Pinguiococcus_pyrenoidosus.AAC.26
MYTEFEKVSKFLGRSGDVFLCLCRFLVCEAVDFGLLLHRLRTHTTGRDHQTPNYVMQNYAGIAVIGFECEPLPPLDQGATGTSIPWLCSNSTAAYRESHLAHEWLGERNANCTVPAAVQRGKRSANRSDACGDVRQWWNPTGCCKCPCARRLASVRVVLPKASEPAIKMQHVARRLDYQPELRARRGLPELSRRAVRRSRRPEFAARVHRGRDGDQAWRDGPSGRECGGRAAREAGQAVGRALPRRHRPAYVGGGPHWLRGLRARHPAGRHHHHGGARRHHQRAGQGAPGVGGRHLPDHAQRRGHPHGQRAPPHRAHRGAGQEAAHRALAERPGGHGRPPVAAAPARARGARAVPAARDHVRPGGAAHRDPHGRVHAPAARAAGALLALGHVPRRRAAAGRAAPAGPRAPREHPAAGLRRPGRPRLQHRPRRAGAGPGLRGDQPELAGHGVRSRLRGRDALVGVHAADPPQPGGRGPHRDEPAEGRGAQRRLRHGLLAHAAEEESRRAGAAPGKGGAPAGPLLREDKEPLFDCIDTIHDVIQITSGVFGTLKPIPEKLLNTLMPEMLATDLAEYLVRKGVPFRETHHIAGAAVKMAEDLKIPLNSLTVAQLQSLHASFDEDVTREVFDFEKSVERKTAVGGTARRAVLGTITRLRHSVDTDLKPLFQRLNGDTSCNMS